jgi:transketolase
MSAPTPLKVENKLHGNPTSPLRWTAKIKDAEGKEITSACTHSTRAMIALMDMAAVQGGAACHFGGPSAFAEIMSGLHAFMFSKAEQAKKTWHQMFHFVNDAGHCENGLYALKANYNLAGVTLDSLQNFRSIESVLTGHGEAHLFPQGVYVSNGPLGSGLPQAQGLAAAESYTSTPRVTITAISDGGCMEGEARESLAAIPGLAKRKKVGPFICVLSDNNTKLSGRIDEDSFSMNPSFEALEAQGWKLVKIEEGHDLQKVYAAIETAYKDVTANPTQPVFLWFKTIKGKGIKKTEQSPSGGHGFPCKKADELPAFLAEIYSDKEMPKEFGDWMNRLIEKEKAPAPASSSSGPKKEKIQDGVSRALIEAVEKRGRPVVSISADLQGSTGVETFRKKFPENCFDIGVAEANMVSMGIGLSKQGYIPVVDTFAQFGVTKGSLPFIMSGLSEGPMLAMFSHTGFQDAADGASHQALSYAAMLGSIPNVDCYALTCSDEAFALVSEVVEDFVKAREQNKVPRTSIFFLGRETFPPTFNPEVKFKTGKAQVLADQLKGFDKKVVIAASGSLVNYAMKAQEELKTKGVGSVVINPSILNKPDVETFGKYLKDSGGNLITLEDHRSVGGMGSYLVHALVAAGHTIKNLATLGVDEHFGRSAYKADQLYKASQMDDKAIVARTLEMF